MINCAQIHMRQFRRYLFFSWGKNPHESDILRNIYRENWLHNVWLLNKYRFFSKTPTPDLTSERGEISEESSAVVAQRGWRPWSMEISNDKPVVVANGGGGQAVASGGDGCDVATAERRRS
ncbi:hypothetical protein ACFX2I_012198 [Malus domestica]